MTNIEFYKFKIIIILGNLILLASQLLMVSCGTEEPPANFVERPLYSLNLNVENDDGVDDDSTDELNELSEKELDDFFDDVTDQIVSSDDLVSDEDASGFDDDDLDSSISEDNQKVIKTLSDEQKELCASLVSDDDSEVTDLARSNLNGVSDSSLLGVHITGRSSIFNLDLASSSASSLRGVCIFISGNQNLALLQLTSINLSRLIVIARGNKPQVQVTMLNDSSIASLVADLSGNQSELFLTAGDNTVCPEDSVYVRGNSSGYLCSEEP